MAHLTIQTENGELLVELFWEQGVPRIAHVKPSLRISVEQWLEYGLNEIVGEGDDAHPRVTPASSPEFLPRLADYINRQFSNGLEAHVH